jgi:hypothetical protein
MQPRLILSPILQGVAIFAGTHVQRVVAKINKSQEQSKHQPTQQLQDYLRVERRARIITRLATANFPPKDAWTSITSSIVANICRSITQILCPNTELARINCFENFLPARRNPGRVTRK